MDIRKLLTEHPLDPNISREDFREDVDCLFQILRESYGGYDHFGHENFLQVRDAVMADIAGIFDFHAAVDGLRARLMGLVKDGHFSVGAEKNESARFDFAVRRDEWNGIPVIDCKRFWYESEKERAELEGFAESGSQYRGDAPLILDLLDNPGGSDVYICDFIRNLFGVEPQYACRFIQRYSPLFREYLNRQGIPAPFKGAVKQRDEDNLPIHSRKPIYVLVNRGTCSSGESAVAYLKTVTSAVIVGERTGGAFSFGNCVRIWLPHSHLPVYFGTGMVLYEKTRNIDAEGGFRGDIAMEEFRKMLHL